MAKKRQHRRGMLWQCSTAENGDWESMVDDGRKASVLDDKRQ